MYQLQIASLILLVAAIIVAVALWRRHRDWRLLFTVGMVGLIAWRELLELLELYGFTPSEVRWYWMRGVPVGLLALLAVAFLWASLAERKRAEERLQRGNLIYKSVFGAVADTIVLIDRQSLLIVEANQAASEKFGYSREELIGKPVTEFSAEPQKTAAGISAAEPKVPLRYLRKKDGTIFPAEIANNTFSQDAQEFLISVVRDISHRIYEEERARHGQERLERHNQALSRLSRSSVWQEQGLQAAFCQITEIAAAALGVERVGIWLFNEDRTRIVCRDLYERGGNRHQNGLELNAKDYPSYFAALEEDRTIAAHDAHTDPRTCEFSENYLAPLEIVAMLDAPIRILGKNAGVVCHEQVGAPRRWEAEEENFAASIADFVATAIEAEERRKTGRTVERLAEIMQLTTDFVGISNVDGHAPFLNRSGRKMLGIADSENIAELQVRDFLPDPAWKLYRQEALPLVMIDGIWSGETSLQRRDGSQLAVSQVIIGHKGADGKIEYLSTVMRDISGTKRAEQALRQSEERYRALYEDNPSMYFTVDPTGIVLSVNRYGAEHLGYRVKELVGKPVLNVFHEEDKAAVSERFQTCLREPDKVTEWEFRKLTKDGALMWVKEYVRVVKGADGRTVVLIVCDDITERKNAEGEIHKLNTELQESNEQMRRLAVHLQDAREQERKRISLEIHDELGQQLTNFKFELKRYAIEMGKNNPEIVLKTQSLSALVGEMMKTVRRIATELRPGVLDTLGLTAAIEWQLQEFERSTRISTRCNKIAEDLLDEGFLNAKENGEAVPTGNDKATAVFRIFQEALTNVARHSGATEVQVTLDCQDDLLRLEVRDNGVGVTEHQLRNSRSLGVLGMRERAKIFGGSLTIHGREGAGTTTVLEMPLG